MSDSKLFREGEREEILPFSGLPVEGIEVRDLEEVLPSPLDIDEAIRGLAPDSVIYTEGQLTFGDGEIISSINNLEPTAAGNIQTEDSGHTIVEVDYNNPEAEVTSGFDTEGVRASQSHENDLPLPLPLVNDFRSVSSFIEPPTGIPDDNADPTEDDPEGIVIIEDVLPPEEDIPEVPPKVGNQNNGFGSGNQDAPGNSEFNNNAENAGGNHDGTANQGNGNPPHILPDIPQIVEI